MLNGKWDVMLHYCEPKTVIEIRIRDTMNGKHTDQYVEADHRGIAVVDIPQFGKHLDITLRELNTNALELQRLHVIATKKQNRITMSTHDEDELINKAAEGAQTQQSNAVALGG